MALPQQRTFDDLGAPLWTVPFCVLDLETTGGSAANCEITEIGAVRFVGGEPDGTFQTLVDPGGPIPPFITVLTGITQAMVIEAPPIEEALPTLLEFIGDAVIVGHNVRFDMSFLNAAALRLGYGRLPHRTADTAALARRLIRSEVRNLKLATLARHFRSPVTPNHRALEDAQATAHVFFALLERAGTVGVTHLEDLMQLPTAKGAPHYGKIRLADELPRRPGVYLLKDASGSVFYIGKAKNLRTRVRSYFYGDGRRRVTTMLAELQEIDYRLCATELEAEVAELRLIHAHRPRHNRRSKPPKTTWFVKFTAERFPRLSMVRTVKAGDGPYLGPFRSKRHAERVVSALWDAAPLRRCTARPGTRQAPCAAAQLGVSMCPCAGTADEEAYRAVVAAAVESLDGDGTLLLDRLQDKMAAHAAAERFEEARWALQRFRALAGAMRRRRAWRALQAAGVIEAIASDGACVLIDRGRLVASWHGPTPPLGANITESEVEPEPIPPSVAAAEEAHLVWKWLTSEDCRLVRCSGGLAMPWPDVPEPSELA